MKKRYDVIIIGAGPSGLKCAEVLKNSKLSVLIIEKNNVIGPKLCGGGLTSLVNHSDIPINKTRSFKIQYTYLGNKEHKIYFINPVKTIDRFDLGQYQLNKIKRLENIDVLSGCKVNKIFKTKIMTNKGDFYYNYLVGADGSNSIVRKFLGLKTKLYIGFCYNIDKKTNKFKWIFNPTKIKSAYVWLFPHKNYTNVGIYFNPSILNLEDAKNFLISRIEKEGYKIKKEDLRGAPVNYCYSGIKFDNIFLVGDAAGLASKVWGEGIPHALISGSEVAKKIMNPNYKMRQISKILKIKRRQEFIGDMFNLIPPLQKFFIRLFIKLMDGWWFHYYFGIALKF